MSEESTQGGSVEQSNNVGTQEDQSSQEQFSGVDPNSLTPELASVYKSLQSDYTKKTQELSNKSKDFERISAENAQYQELLKDEAFVKAVQSFREPEKVSPSKEPETMEDLLSMISEMIDQKIRPEIGKIGEKIKPIEENYSEQQANKILADFEKSHSDFKDYAESMGSILEKSPHYTLEDAYVLAKARAPKKETVSNATSISGNVSSNAGSKVVKGADLKEMLYNSLNS